jgi:hypothetical protein
MTDVTVDLVDLETLVFTTGALKTIEGALQARKNDPFVQPHLNFTEAHNRLAEAMRNATRGQNDTVVPWDGELDAVERACLSAMAEDEDERLFITITPKWRLEHQEYDRLMCKGMIVIGQLVKGIIWGGASAAEIKPDPSGFAVKTTKRGRDKLKKLAA